MPRRLVVCFDGTWNSPDREGNVYDEIDAETNVVHLFRAIKGESCGSGVAGCTTQDACTPTIKWYDAGVGAKWYEHIRGGAFGFGLSRNIRRGYKFLVDTYLPGDEIYVFGFSRGAYTARSLVGLIRNSGLLDRSKLLAGNDAKYPGWTATQQAQLAAMDPDDVPQIMDAYQLYRNRDGSADTPFAIEFRNSYAAPDVRIKVLGVWDTVGALGIPLQAAASFNAEQYGFHDLELSGIVDNGFHALALDEHREDYRATLWNPSQKPQQNVEQVWFVGAHADVGGGYQHQPLSLIPLMWMMKKAELKGGGLEFDAAGVPQTAVLQLPGLKVTDSFGSFLCGLYRLIHKPYLRPVLQTVYGQEALDPSVEGKKEADSCYKPKNPGLPWLEPCDGKG
jgi:uncharacterized protein (DUF2235 family)